MPPELEPPPQWGLLLGDVGRGLIWLGLVAFVASAFGWMWSARKPDARWGERLGRLGFWVGAGALAGTFAVLATLFLTDQYQFAYVYGHSDTQNSVAFRIAAVWSGQEGSFLLWGVCSAIFGVWVAPLTGHYRRWFTVPYALFLAGICAILAYESPYALQFVAGQVMRPVDGAGLTPALQNYWVVIHPPIIFLGFGSLTVMACWAISAMVNRDYEGWVPGVRPWAIFSLALLGLGLCLGGLWAYETLGWGGFWAWDPVENTSFVPWCLTAALIHGLIVQGARRRWTRSNLLLAGLPFLSFLYGTFLTRSGVLGETSVHSFAQMNRVALWILVGLGAAFVLGFLALWIRSVRRAEDFADERLSMDEWRTNREALYRTGMTLLILVALTTAIGMSFPFFTGLSGSSPKVVETPLYDRVLVFAFIPILLLVAIAPFVSWRGLPVKELLSKLLNVFSVSIALVGVILLWMASPSFGMQPRREGTMEGLTLWQGMTLGVPVFFWATFCFWLCIFAAVANLWRLGEMWKRSRGSAGAFISHFGLAVLLGGLIVSKALERHAEDPIFVQPGLSAATLGYLVSYTGQSTDDLFNRDNKLIFSVQGPDETFQVKPGLYFIRQANGDVSQMVWPYIVRRPGYDFYFTLHPLVMDYSEPVSIALEDTVQINDFKVTYEEFTREGEPGMAGSAFGAMLRFETSQGFVFHAHPKMIVGEGPEPDRVGPELMVNMQRMDAATRDITIQLHFIQPIMPVEIFVKPLTWLVWLGTGILFFGGILAAIQRRLASRHVPAKPGADPEPSSLASDDPASTAQV
ncbi:MAG: cytochrome c biogenesis protein CcsA [Fimbriimonadaceae bacterium]